MFSKILGRKQAAQEIAIRVTEKGFEPARVQAARGETTTLVVTRMTDRTCARELVLDELGIRESLPLGKAVRIELTPMSSGPLKFGCAMGKMVSGVLDVA